MGIRKGLESLGLNPSEMMPIELGEEATAEVAIENSPFEVTVSNIRAGQAKLTVKQRTMTVTREANTIIDVEQSRIIAVSGKIIERKLGEQMFRLDEGGYAYKLTQLWEALTPTAHDPILSADQYNRAFLIKAGMFEPAVSADSDLAEHGLGSYDPDTGHDR